jgi:3-oxoacyl-(acyl-carrier-protein) synthase
MTKPRVAITGTGCVSALGMGQYTIWENLQRGTVSCGPVPEWLFHTELPYPVFTALPEPISEAGRDLLEDTLPDFPTGAVSRTLLLAISAVAEAIEKADLNISYLRKTGVGIALGTTVGSTFNNESYYLAWRQGLSPNPGPVHNYLGSNLASALHVILGTRGPSAVITNACASGTDAIGLARGWIAHGQCELAIAGGADELSRIAYNGFASLQLTDLSPCKPFDQNRKGLNLGEGAGIIIMESQDRALRRGTSPIGWARGYGSASDAWHPTAPHPEGRGLKCAFDRAISDAGVHVQGIALINAHGTGTRANDLAETKALAALLLDPDEVPIVSTKGLTGHTLGAAGAIEAIFALVTLQHGQTSGTVGCFVPDPALSVKPLPEGQTSRLRNKLGISQSLAFGGSNSVLILEAA